MNVHLSVGAGLCIWILLSACAVDAPPASAHPAAADPTHVDAEFPPAMHEFSFRSDGSKLNGLAYTADGPGPHPVVLLLHGFAGNERNLDLAQALRRSGANVFYFNYRGAWGSGGTFSVSNSIADAAEALAFVQSPEAIERFRNDGDRIAIVGHSFGGFVGAITAAEHEAVDCFAYLAGADFGVYARMGTGNPEVQAAFVEALAPDMDPDGGPIRGSAESMVVEIIDSAADFSLTTRAPALSRMPVLMVAGSRDLTAAIDQHHRPVVTALEGAGAIGLTELVLDDDHYFSAHRVRLAVEVSDWMWGGCWP